MARAIVCILTLAVSAIVAVAVPVNGSSAEPSCVQVTWQAVAADCAWSYADYSATASSGDGHTWVVSIQCGNGGICAEHVECNEEGEEGFVHDVYMDGVDVGDVCVPARDVDQVGIAKLVVREFRRMTWPSSQLVVQPPDGRTLVNFKTNFFTPNTQAIPRRVTLANQVVEIQAVPSTYTFDFGDGMNLASASPGRPHPDLDVTHVYEKTGKVAVSLSTTYRGEYRIGGGAWTAIPGTVTVAGTAQNLQVVEALPQLVLR